MSIIGMLFLRPEDLPEGFHTPFMSSMARTWAWLNGLFVGLGFMLLFTSPFKGWLIVTIVLFTLATLCDRREKRWAKRLREEIR
jgi:uncharacterized membrane protein YccC